MNLIKFGAFVPASPSEYGVELFDLDGENSGRSETGYANRDRVRAGIFKIKLGWTNLTSQDLEMLLRAVEPDVVAVTFFFGRMISTDMYAGNRTISLKSQNEDGNTYWDVSFNMTEM